MFIIARSKNTERWNQNFGRWCTNERKDSGRQFVETGRFGKGHGTNLPQPGKFDYSTHWIRIRSNQNEKTIVSYTLE